MTRIEVSLHFGEPGYIALPYWPARDMLINIMKPVHPKLGDTKKAAAVRASCEKLGVTQEQYEQILIDAVRPFHTVNGAGSEIIIPERIFQSFLNHSSMEAPKVVPRITEKGMTFIGVKVDGACFHTGKKAPDGSFDRFVKNQQSNQRQLTSSPYIRDFMATAVLKVDGEVIAADKLKKLVEWGGKWIGIGSARAQGYGRFSVAAWQELSTANAVA
jgi:hypothetical protein